jgi:hypothetical protein
MTSDVLARIFTASSNDPIHCTVCARLWRVRKSEFKMSQDKDVSFSMFADSNDVDQTVNADGVTRDDMTSFWKEHSNEASEQEMMLDSNAEKLGKEEVSSAGFTYVEAPGPVSWWRPLSPGFGYVRLWLTADSTPVGVGPAGVCVALKPSAHSCYLFKSMATAQYAFYGTKYTTQSGVTAAELS